MLIEGVDLTDGIEGHPELICVAIVVNGTVIVLEKENDQDTAAEKDETT